MDDRTDKGMEATGLLRIDAAPTDITPEQVAIRATDALCRVTEVMAQIAANVAAMTEGMQQLTRRMDQMDGLTAGQAKALAAMIRLRVRVLCDSYGIAAEDERRRRRVGELIKQALRNSVGTDRRGLRDLPRCEYQVYLDRVAMWDDYDVMREVAGNA